MEIRTEIQTASPALKSKSILVNLESGTVIENNHAKEGAAIYVNHYSTVTMKEGSEIRNNVSESNGTVYVIGNGGYFEMAGELSVVTQLPAMEAESMNLEVVPPA